MIFIRNIFIVFCILLASCQHKGQKEKKQKVKLNICSEPASLDPRKARSLNCISISGMLFEGLMRYSKDGRIENGLCEDFSVSRDGKEYIFNIRDAFWSNGDHVTAHDFVYSWKSMLDPKGAYPNAYQLFIIKNAHEIKEGNLPLDALGVVAKDAKTLVVTLNNPAPYFLELLTKPFFYAINSRLDQENSNWMLEENFVGNGPFALDEFQHNDFLRLKNNDLYWDREKVKLREIELVMVTNNVELEMFEANQLDWAGSPLSTLPVDSLQEKKKSKYFHFSPYMGTMFFRINVENIPDKDFRQKIAKAIDRKQLVKHVLQADHVPTTALVPGSENGFDEKLFDDKNNQRSFTISYINKDYYHSLVQSVQRELEKKLGVSVKIEAVESKFYYDRLQKGKYDLALGSWLADFNDPINFLEVFKYKDSSTNNTFWENKTYVDLLDQITTCENEDRRLNLIKDAETLLLDEMPLVPLYHLSQIYLKRDKIRDVCLLSSGVLDLKYAFVDNE